MKQATKTTSKASRTRRGQHFRRLREAVFASQADFLRALTKSGLGITRACVSCWESGISIPKHSALPIVARVLNVSVDELLRQG